LLIAEPGQAQAVIEKVRGGYLRRRDLFTLGPATNQVS
jgi:hypothetical protein